MTERTTSGYGDVASRVAQSVREQKIIDDSIREFSQLHTYRSNRGTQWEESAALIWPQMRNTFFWGSYNFPGLKQTQLQVDSTAMLANAKFAAICDSMMTPFSTQWAELAATNPDVQKDRGVRLYFEKAARILMELRNDPFSGFRRSNSAIWKLTGAFGNAPMFVDQRVDMRGQLMRAMRYKALPTGQVYIRENHQGIIDGFCRFFRLTAHQAYSNPLWRDKLPESIIQAMEKNSEAPIDFLHRVCPNDEYDPERVDAKGMIFSSYYIALTTKTLLSEGGYRSFPLPYARYERNPDDVYADGPAQLVLPTLKTLNAVKTAYVQQSHRAMNPVILTADEGLTNFNARPGATNAGGWSADGKPLAGVLPFGEIQAGKELMEGEQAIIGEAFLTTIFSSLVENPNMTATQVVELINQKGIFLAPMAGSMAPDYLGSMIDREIDLATELKLLPPMPPLLREAQGEYKVVYTSPLFKAARAGDAAGFLRTVESAMTVAGQMNDMSILDPFAFDRAIPAIAEIQSSPPSWMSSDDEIAQKRKARAAAAQQQAQIQALPAQAAMMKAQAAVQKQGGQVAQPQQGQ